MSYYQLDVSRTVKTDLTIKYDCENCGLGSSYTQTYDTSVHESGQTSSKSNAEAHELSKQLSSKAQEFAQEIAEDWKSEGPASFEYHITYEKCPSCGYTQSWMLEYLRERLRSKYIKWPIVIMSFAYIGLYFALERTLNDLVGDLATLSAIGVWAAAAFITYLIGTRFTDPNREFGDVSKVNEPTFIWSEPIITQ